ncbi:MAG: aspartate kinase [Candidatus Midichloria sp.]|nr:MAG: aspartate kinase [Candidatus Midichloria sp.]
MFIVVQKFGGTSVANTDRIKKVAEIIANEKSKGSAIIAVVSAMSGVTDQMVNYAKSLSPVLSQNELAEYDAVISSGEQVTAGLLALALQSVGLKSRSFLGWQLPIVTDNAYSNGRIVSIGTTQLIEALKKEEIPVISGFQGVYNERIVTLGRGGSDTTATAVAAAVCADRCDIFTDVEGVFSADPRIVAKAKKIETIAYKQMLIMATAGAKVIHPRAVDISLSHNLETHILSSFSDTPGTILVKDNKGVERGSILAVVSDSNIVVITIFHLMNDNISINKILDILGELAVPLEFLFGYNQPALDVSFKFTVSKNNLPIVWNILNDLSLNFIIKDEIAKITIVGNGLSENSIILQKMFQILSDEGINIISANTVSTNISIILEAKHKDVATIGLHKGFGLDAI